uniref:Uncharacterized protein n=1 Tax=Picea sitchensis TaxID=3332 RepID=A9NQS1_PICSI|nr:unknown [Picea sitchensis]
MQAAEPFGGKDTELNGGNGHVLSTSLSPDPDCLQENSHQMRLISFPELKFSNPDLAYLHLLCFLRSCQKL